MGDKSSPTAVFALIIGIDKYQSQDFQTLSGAVNDAREFEKFLLDPRDKRGLQVPTSNIVRLENGQATRSAILAALRSHFLENPDIPDHGNATMILFYAGHGTRMEAPGNLMAFDRKVEALCPVDERTKGADGKSYVHAIPDYVLGRLLWELSKKKGNNITVVLDSCHSGGLSRNVGQARNADSPSPWVPLDLDSDLWADKSQTAQSFRLWSASADTHVLLAACRQEETALETRLLDGSIHGRFTQSLTTSLRRVAIEETTYTELLTHIPGWEGQIPHCGGTMRDRPLFGGNYAVTDSRTFPLKLHTPPKATKNTSNAQNSHILQAFEVEIGAVDGVVTGTEFLVRAPNRAILGTLVASSVEIGRTLLVTKDKKPLELLLQCRVEVSDWKNDAMILHIYTPPLPDFPYATDLFPTIVTNEPTRRKYVQAPSAESANLIMRLASNVTMPSVNPDIIVEWSTGKILASQPLKHFSTLNNTLDLPRVVDGIAHFSYFLERHNQSTSIPGVTLEMHRLSGTFPGRQPILDGGPVGDGNLIAKVALRYEAKFVPQTGDVYGFTIRNDSHVDLFPYLFYFDPVEYTITPWYTPAGARVHAPLKKNGGTVTLGMGGEQAWEFALAPNEETESAYLKLFVATEHLKIEWIGQEISPFDPTFQWAPRMVAAREPFVYVPQWDAFNVTLTLCRELPQSADPDKQSSSAVNLA